MLYAMPGQADARIQYKTRYDNFIGGKWVAPVKGDYFDVLTPISGSRYTQAARSTAEDVELALDAAHAAFPTWSRCAVIEHWNEQFGAALPTDDLALVAWFGQRQGR